MSRVQKTQPVAIENPLLLSSFDLSTGQPAEVALFVITSMSSKKGISIRHIELNNLTSEKRMAKMRKWAEGDRFVAIIEKGDQVFAHVSPKVAQELAQKDQKLTFQGKDVQIKALTEEGYENLAKITEAFIEVLSQELDNEQAETTKKEAKSNGAQKDLTTRYYVYLPDMLGSTKGVVRLMIEMHNVTERIKSHILKRMEEDIREQRERSIETEKKRRIEKRVLDRAILNEQITHEGIKSQIIKNGVIKEVVETQHVRINRAPSKIKQDHRQ